jgi:RNA processing factor Prp31
MRVKEWYAWHFPELGKVITDNIMVRFSSVVLRPNCVCPSGV